MLKVVLALVTAWPPRVVYNNRFGTTKPDHKHGQTSHTSKGPGICAQSVDQTGSKALVAGNPAGPFLNSR